MVSPHTYFSRFLCLSRRSLMGVLVLLVAGSWASMAFSSPMNCESDQCGLQVDGAYPDYVIGTLTHIGTDADMKRVFRWAKHHGYWKSLPTSAGPYLKRLQLMTIAPDSSRQAASITVFMPKREFEAAPYHVGALVRYRSHGQDVDEPENPVALAFFKGLTGCIVTLCSREDKACRHRYKPGVYTPEGHQVDPDTGEVMAGGVTIDTVSLLPESSEAKADTTQ